MEPSFQTEVNRFVERIESMRVTLPIMVRVISDANQQAQDGFKNFLLKKGIEGKEKEGKITYLVSPEDLTVFRKLEKEQKSAELASSFVPTTFLIALISQYDAYIGRLIRVLFLIKSELLSSSERQMTFSDIIKFESVNDAKDFIIEKEIETVLRKSHSEQIQWLEKKLAMPFTKELEIWPDFIEVTERRNLFVHADGVVSTQYRNVCKMHGVKSLDDAENCKKLSVSLSYFEKSCNCIFEMGVKIAHVIWRKLQPEDRKNADENLNELCGNLILFTNYQLAIILLNFATDTLPKYSSEQISLLFKINKAQALKWNNQEKECRDELNAVDWSAKGLKFKLAKLVLEENYEEAVSTMRSIGKQGEVTATDYKTRPIFQKFRQTDFFLTAFEDVFGEKFELVPDAEGKIELQSNESMFECAGLDIEQFKYDINQCIETGIRKCCVDNDNFPPLEIHTDELSQNLLRFIVGFEPSAKHELNMAFTVIINVKMLNIGDQTIQLNCAGVLIESGICRDLPPYSTPFFEGIFDEGIIWNAIDQVFFQLIGKAKKQELDGDGEKMVKGKIWLNL
jgi:hypothetical protein